MSALKRPPTPPALRPYPLEPSTSELRDMVDAAMAQLLPHVASLDRQDASYPPKAADFSPERAPLPETPTPLPTLLETLFQRHIPLSYNTAGPGYLGYIPGGGIVHAAIADLIADVINRYTGIWATAPGLVQLEIQALQWLCEIVGYPPDAGGILTSGGSLANFTALVTARSERLPRDFLKGTLYTSEQTHHSVQKAAILAGFPPENVRKIPSDEAFRISLPALTEQLQRDRANGWTPFLLVGNAGTTNTGAIDPLNALADLAETEGLWLHIDAAYGGFFVLTKQGKERLKGLARADSITLDPHKGMFLPYGTGALLVRDPQALRRTHSLDADYLPPMHPEQMDFSAISPELSRDFRGLRLWLPLKMLGLQAWKNALEEKLQLTQWITEQLQNIEHIEIIAPPELSLMAFRYAPPGHSPDALNQLNRQWLAQTNAQQRVFLTGTTVRGNTFVLRICVLCFRTHLDRMQICLEDLLKTLPSPCS